MGQASVRVATALAWLTTLAGAEAAAQDRTADPQAQSQSSGVLRRLTIEELGRIQVISTSRQSEVLSEAAAAVTILTADTLRRAGVTNLPDALRLAAGVAVGRVGHAWSVSARGFQATTANKMVVLVDGRSVYSPLFSGVFWDSVDLVLADIDRIEIIRGAGGSLWGANAVNGVINIITRLAADTQGALVEVAGGPRQATLSARYGGRAGQSGHYRVYAKLRRLSGPPFATGVETDEDLTGGQFGMRFDRDAGGPTSLTLRADVFDQRVDLVTGGPADAFGANVLGRLRRTFTSGAQLQTQLYYDTTFRRVPTQYAERRHSVEGELQYAFSAGPRQHIVAGAGLSVTHDEITPTVTFSFAPLSRTSPLLNVFVQDDVSLVTGRLHAIGGIKIEHNDYTGVEYQPTIRLRWTPATRHTVWVALSRAVRMPTRFDTDLRFTAGTSTVVLRGDPAFRSETVLAREAGYRARLFAGVSASAAVFWNTYDDLRSQEPTPPLGIPIVIANKHHGRVAGVELAMQVEPTTWWHLNANYSYLAERFGFDPDSLDVSGGALEHNDPPHQFKFRSFTDLPGRWSVDAVYRWVAALPQPSVPAYSDLTLRLARPLGRGVDVEIIGEHLLDDQHLEFLTLAPARVVPRSAVVRVLWQSR